jgi:hypothetical protein
MNHQISPQFKRALQDRRAETVIHRDQNTFVVGYYG